MLRRLVLIFSVIVVVLVAWKWTSLKAYFDRVERTTNAQQVTLLLRSDPTFSELASILVEEGVVESRSVLIDQLNREQVATSNFAGGKYIILSGTRLDNLIDGFLKNEEGQGNAEIKVKVVFNRCRDIYDIGKNISKCILADSTSIVDHVLKQETLDKYGFTKEQMPALFLPKEYEMYFDTDAEGFVAFMAERFKEFWNEERMEQMKRIGMQRPSQVVTLASIVYSEQKKVPEEWPIIARLYLNRLNRGMRLQSDPTFKFCWGDKLDGVQRLLNKHRDIDCPYNTYKIDGLPPGPICITPEGAIEAVLRPDENDFIFMCAKPDYSGGHNFTASGAQHERNAARYRKWLANELRNR